MIKMYTRDFSDLPEKLIIDGTPQFGTYKTSPQKFDIKHVREPFSCFPMPKFFSNLRIRANITYVLNIDNFYGVVDFLIVNIFVLSKLSYGTKKLSKDIPIELFLVLNDWFQKI
ncbi:MAG: hypothetical protein UIH41_06905 [Treponemataceae bacterium]|nr:hypothetical protein [Treponemataceae bacterium]